MLIVLEIYIILSVILPGKLELLKYASEIGVLYIIH